MLHGPRFLLLTIPSMLFSAAAFSAASALPAGARSVTAFRPAGTSLPFPASPADTLPQPLYPKGYFRLPLDLPVALSGSFGELRSNHFHTGLDIKTNQRTGYPVHAAADGYISRLREGASGYGKAVYIDHPNGFTTVYGHLERFAEPMAGEMKQYQYAHETFEADFQLEPGRIPVKKGQLIAWSGNSGSSGGPHVHFEIRHTASEDPLNPLLFGLPVPDSRRPSINGMFIYPLNDSSSVNGKPFRAGFTTVSKGNGEYAIEPRQKITVNGRIGFGIISTDQFDGAANRNGIYSLELKKDGRTIYFSENDRLSFSTGRALNAYIDYGAYLLDGRRIQKSYVLPGNPLRIYKRLSNKGSAYFFDDREHLMEYIVSDAAGNRSVLRFTVTAAPERKQFDPDTADVVARFRYDRPNRYAAPGFRLSMDTGVLYDHADFTYRTGPAPQGAWSPLHRVHREQVPVHDYFDIWIKADPARTVAADTAKTLVADQDRRAFVSSWENGWVKARVREFGNFYITTDRKAPTIRAINIYAGKDMSANSAIVLRISDDLSGLRSYRGTIDGKWVLMEFDAKTATLKHVFDERTPPGKHTFRLVVTDMKNNTATFEAAFTR